MRIVTALLLVLASAGGLMAPAGAATCADAATTCGCSTSVDPCGGCCGAGEDPGPVPFALDDAPIVCSCDAGAPAPVSARAADAPPRQGAHETCGAHASTAVEGAVEESRTPGAVSALVVDGGARGDTAHDPASLSVWRL